MSSPMLLHLAVIDGVGGLDSAVPSGCSGRIPPLWSPQSSQALISLALALTSFYRLILATVLRVLRPPSLSLHLSLNGTLGRRSLSPRPPPPAPHVLFLHVRLWSSASPLQR